MEVNKISNIDIKIKVSGLNKYLQMQEDGDVAFLIQQARDKTNKELNMVYIIETKIIVEKTSP